MAKGQLTWQAGAAGRIGRWKKKYRGRVCYFSGGRGKSDRDALRAALKAFDIRKAEIDAEDAKKGVSEYEQAISQWEAARAWATEHNDAAMVAVAIERIERLDREMQRSRPKRLDADLTFESYFSVDVRYPSRAAAMRDLGTLADARLAAICGRGSNAPIDASDPGVIDPRDDAMFGAAFDDPFSLRPLQTEQAIWHDRIAVMQRDRQTSQASTLGALAGQFIAAKRLGVSTGDISAGRVSTLASHVEALVQFLGSEQLPAVVNSARLMGYRNHLLEEIASKKWSAKTASTRIDSAKQFIRWLWNTENIDQLPRAMATGSHDLTISAPASPIRPCGFDEVSRLFSQASRRMRLYMLLALNTGMTQKDIADLTHEEIDFEASRIERKRSKTRKLTNVPKVSYLLWPETCKLLASEISKHAKLALTNERGDSLWTEKLLSDGRLQKTDNIRTAFSRLAVKAGVDASFKSLKKLSASTLRGDGRFNAVCGIFLGHAPATIAERHYAAAPQNLLDEAITWLGSVYRDASCIKAKPQLDDKPK